jgi:hypothetical protein
MACIPAERTDHLTFSWNYSLSIYISESDASYVGSYLHPFADSFENHKEVTWKIICPYSECYVLKKFSLL